MKIFIVHCRLHSRFGPAHDDCCSPCLGAMRSRESAKEAILSYLTDLFKKHLHKDFLTCGSHRFFLYLPIDIVSRLTTLGFEVAHSEYDPLIKECSIDEAIITEQVLTQLSKNPKEFLDLFLSAPRGCECEDEDMLCTYDEELATSIKNINLFTITEIDLE